MIAPLIRRPAAWSAGASGWVRRVSATSDDLTRPLGIDRPAPKSGRISGALPAAAGTAVALFAGIAGYVLFLGDPAGGIPRARVDIAVRPKAAEPDPVRPAAEPDTGIRVIEGRSGAAEVEKASGVSVVRPDGATAPASVIVRVPDEVSLTLNPAPDPRLLDRTRYGALPRVGPDGARALDVYARPVAGLPGGARPAGRVAIVVGGLGISRGMSVEAIGRLPPAVTLAFAPYGGNLDGLATSARNAGHEIMLQVPMEPFDYPDSDPGPHTLTTGAKPAENIEHLQWAMGRLTGYVGLVNYMGGKLTADDKAIAPVLREAGQRGLGFLDDGSSSRSVVPAYKGETRIARAEVVLDASARADAIDKALAKLEAQAATGALAIGTATALPLSVDRIERWARGLEARGILLVPASAALRGATREAAASR